MLFLRHLKGTGICWNSESQALCTKQLTPNRDAIITLQIFWMLTYGKITLAKARPIKWYLCLGFP